MYLFQEELEKTTVKSWTKITVDDNGHTNKSNQYT